MNVAIFVLIDQIMQQTPLCSGFATSTPEKLFCCFVWFLSCLEYCNRSDLSCDPNMETSDLSTKAQLTTIANVDFFYGVLQLDQKHKAYYLSNASCLDSR